MTKMEVMILEQQGPNSYIALEGDIRNCLKNGWELSGELIVTSGNRFSPVRYVQRMTKPDSPPPGLDLQEADDTIAPACDGD